MLDDRSQARPRRAGRRAGAGGPRGLAVVSIAAVLTACPEAPLRRARLDLAAGRLDEAGQGFLTEARRDPAHLAAWDGAVEVWCQRRVHVARCLEVLDLELELLGTVERHRDALSAALEARARARLSGGLVEAALADLDRAERAGPERASVHVARARALVTLGHRAEALDALMRARAIDPNHAEIDAVIELLPSEGLAEPSAPGEGFGGER